MQKSSSFVPLMSKENYHIHGLRWKHGPLYAIISVLLFASCNPAKRLEDGQYLLIQNDIIYRPLNQTKPQKNNLINNQITSIPVSEIAKLKLPEELAVNQINAYIKQKPNTKIFGVFSLHVWVYNQVDPEKMKEKRVLKDQKIDAKNKKIAEENIVREKNGKKPKPFKSKEPGTFSDEWVRGLGEAPVVLDSTLMERSVEQIMKYLHSKGYFDARVTDSVYVKGKIAEVAYIISQGKPYTINKVTYQLDDSTLSEIVYKDSANSLIKQGNNYDEDILRSERDRITKNLKNDGYFAFSKEYVHYEVDTNASTKKADIVIGIKKFAYLDPLKPDSVIETFHHKFFIRNVIIQMNFNPSEPSYQGGDTLLTNGYMIVYPKGKLAYHPRPLLNKIHIKPGDMYKVTNAENTYTGLSQLKTFRYVNIRLVKTNDTNKLDCLIQLMPNTKQSIVVEGVVPYTGGDWGVQGDIAYQDNNLLRGTEVLQVKIKGALEAQTLLSAQNTNQNGVSKSVTLNTVDIGPDIGLTVPRPLNIYKIFPINPATANPQTAFKITGDYQNQPDYRRYIVTGSYGYDFNSGKFWHWNATLFEANYVNAINSQSFLDEINSEHNFFLLNSFNTHAITDARMTSIFNNQSLTSLHNFDYVKISGEISGLTILRLYDQAISNKDKVAEVPYSHYIKGDFEWRHYIVFNKDNKIAIRFLSGAGVPLSDSVGHHLFSNNLGQELPFDKSYWAGGSNDIRAWVARTLGPGGSNQSIIVDQVGDIKLELNAEYRVTLVKFFGLGFFVDAGNIWLMNNNPVISHGNFVFSGKYAFYNQFAVGSGVGLRFDFTYFVFRIDFAVPMIDPSRQEDYSLEEIHEVTRYERIVTNFGIGFPF
ncbi:MAG: BamA/TamA family outer membrane protein [Bacteroidia bacterium]